jgi:uncharacterized protein
MKPKHNVVGWFEIPVTNMNRAMKFYSKVFDVELSRSNDGKRDMAMFPWIQKTIGAGGTLVYHKDYAPSKKGILVYFTAFSGDLKKELGRVRKAGGKVLMNKTTIGKGMGHIGMFLDSEGNRIALHSMK